MSLAHDTLTDVTSYIDKEGHVSYKTRFQKRKVSNQKLWDESWSAYTELMTMYHGVQVFKTMEHYRRAIAELDKKIIWPAVSALDLRHRCNLSKRSIDFSSVDANLKNMVLDSTAIKQYAIRCTKCRSTEHETHECDFPVLPLPAANPPGKKSGGKFGGNRTSQHNGGSDQLSSQHGKSAQSSSQICNNFNNNKCTSRNCTRAHIRRVCRGPLPFEVCQRQGKCASGKVQLAGPI